MQIDIMQIFWIFLILSMLQPMLQRRLLKLARERRIALLEKQRGSRVILMVHRQETMSILGIPLIRYIDMHDSEEVVRAIRMTDDNVPIDLIVHSPGGLALAAIQIARALHSHPAKVTVFVPHHAMSGGTLIALAADEIVMCPHSVLGPIDPQVKQYPAASVLTVLERKDVSDIDDETLILADVGEKAIQQLGAVAEELLQRSMPADKAVETAHRLSTGLWTHDFPIGADAAKALGLSISLEMPDEVLDMMRFYPQPLRTQSAVEYLPDRRHRPAPPSKPSRRS